ncbi:hypothetical protein PI23P_02132 [Polaribacter irgensii 23-P]|uniref:Uncharacterized protein n=1 Tax=Polaribacter irgensii 23-P TaxID=313594 RepID=A4BWB3_9FLAO|nr:hypothetical protein PI23P_02132 [Polaribacter irgensii 23-P]
MYGLRPFFNFVFLTDLILNIAIFGTRNKNTALIQGI